MNDTIVTIRGWVGGVPRHYDPEGNEAMPVTFLNVGVTPRYYSRVHSEYKEGVTTWYSVRCYGRLAKNAAGCLSKGTPVLVRGRLSQREWVDASGVVHSSFDVNADSIGVEISTGVANYVKVLKNPPGDMRDDRWRTEPKGEGAEGEAGADGEMGGSDPGADVVDIAGLDQDAFEADDVDADDAALEAELEEDELV